MDSILELKACFNELIGVSYRDNCFIEIEDKENEIVLEANREGMLYLIKVLIDLCEHNKNYSHYHLDEAGMANRCNKPMVIYLAKDNL
jgi:hypothetical protein